jgi:hypothetical protein
MFKPIKYLRIPTRKELEEQRAFDQFRDYLLFTLVVYVLVVIAIMGIVYG